MSQLTQKEIDIFSQKILEDYDSNNPGTIFKDKIIIIKAPAFSYAKAIFNLV